MTKVALYGLGGHAKVVLECITDAQLYEVVRIYDDNPKGDLFEGVPVEKPLQSIDFPLFISIGNNLIRRKIVEKYDNLYIQAFHPQAIISRTVQIGEGTLVMPGAVLNAEAVIGNHCIINTSCVVEHDCVLDNYVHISPKAALAGGVTVGEGTQIGIGAVVKQYTHIGKWVTVGAGAVVVKDVPDYAVVVGNPARIIKYNEKVF